MEFGYDNSFAILNVNLHKHCSIISMFYSRYLVSPFVLLLLAIVLSVLPRYTDSDYPFGILKLFLNKAMGVMRSRREGQSIQ